MVDVTKVTLHYADGSTKELTDEIGYIVCHWIDKAEGEIQYTASGLHADRIRMVGILLDAFADRIEKDSVSEDELLILEQVQATKAVEDLLARG